MPDSTAAAGEQRAARPRRGRLLWSRYLSLTAQFSIVSSAVLLLGMLVQGSWIAATIEEKAKYHAGTAAALFVDHVIAPYFSRVEPGAALSATEMEAVHALMRRASERMHVAAMKIWSPRGEVLYSSNPHQIGQSFSPSPSLRMALDGGISVEFDVLEDDESELERNLGVPLIEVYVPIRDAAGRVVAVAEFYENAEVLNRELLRSRRDTWLVTGAVFVAMIGALLVIVSRGSRLIDKQRHDLTDKVQELSVSLDHNTVLQGRVERASQQAAEESEQFLHRLGSDLHDGPAQLISFALLRLDGIGAGPAAEPSETSGSLASVRTALTDAMNEVRSICAGLSMPGIASLPCAEALASIVKDHERRTGTAVTCKFEDLPPDTPHFIKTAVCRFVQEGLNNAFRHAGGKGQSVTAILWDGAIIVEVADQGPGMVKPVDDGGGSRLGLVGLANRIRNLGGSMQIRTLPGDGTRITAWMPLVAKEGRSP